MKRNADITVRSGEAAYTARGAMEELEGGARVTYEEPAALGMEDVTTTLTVRRGVAELARVGAVRCAFRFEAGKPHSSVYETPHGSFPAVVETHAVRARLDGRGGIIELRYRLTLGGAADEHRLRLLVRTEEEA